MTKADFDDFYRAEFRGLVVLAAAVLGQRVGAEDVAQEAMVDLYRRWNRVGAYEAPRAWARKVVVQRGMKVAKKRSNEREAHLRAVHEPVSTSTGFLEPALLGHLRELPPQQRAVVALHHLEDLSVRDTADVLGIAEGTVKAHLSKGRAALGAAIERDQEEAR